MFSLLNSLSNNPKLTATLTFSIQLEMNEAKASSRESRKLVQQANQELSLAADEREQLQKDCSNINEKFNIARSSLETKVSRILL